MLEYLRIRNLALIEDMELEFSDGINVLSGETGAGKSFILKALGFVLGDKLAAEIVRPGADRAQVEALFQLDDKELILRREIIAASGRSRFYINDSLSSQEAMRDLRSQLLSHTSQHAQQQLLNPNFQARLLENNLSKPDLLIKRDELLGKIKEVSSKIKELEKKQATLAEKRELLEMQRVEIEKVSPKPGEEERLEEIRAHARANEGAKQNYNRAMAILHGEDGPGLLQLIKDFEQVFGLMSKNDPALEQDCIAVSEIRQQLQSISNQLRRPNISSQKINMDELEERLFAFAQLKRKLKRTLPEILALKDEISENLSFLDVCALDLSRLTKEQNKIAEELADIVEQLKPLRHQAADEFAHNLELQLKELGFSEHIKVIPNFTLQEIWPGIKDEHGHINWSPNPGQNPQPLDRIASGGELSRFLLALNTLGKQNENITFIFDEVDAGVGGLTLNKVGEKLQNFAQNHQIILITHWPQLAAKATKHFQITKEVKGGNTFTHCLPLSQAQRKKELARMAGGGKQGETLANDLLK